MKTVLVHGKGYTTFAVFMRALDLLLRQYAEEIGDCHLYFLVDNKRDAEEASRSLPPDAMTVLYQYESFDPFARNGAHSSNMVRRWEQRYGVPNLRRYIDNERMLTHVPEEAKWRYLLSHIQYFESLCQKIHPDLYICGHADALPTWVAMQVIKGNGVPCVSFIPSRFGRKSFVTDNAYEILGVRQLYRDLLQRGLTADEEQAARAVRETYLERQARPAYLIPATKAMGVRLFPSPRRAVKVVYESLFTDQRFIDLPLRTAVAYSLRARLSWACNLYLRSRVETGIRPEEPFFYFPLHFEPEASLLIMGMTWKDQLELIGIISEALPIDRWLYVKEHPSMRSGHRSIGFYRKLLRLPRVRLLHQRVNSFDVIPQAEAVLTVAGTAGWEALMFNKPVVLFGHNFYEEFEGGVLRPKDPAELTETLRDLRHQTVDDYSLLCFIMAVLSRTKAGIIIEPRYFPEVAPMVLSNENLENVTSIFRESIARATPSASQSQATP